MAAMGKENFFEKLICFAGNQCCQMAKFDPFLSLDCARVEGVGRGGAVQGKEGIKFCSVA